MTQHLERFHAGLEAIRSMEWRLRGLAAAFVRTGNAAVADELFEVAAQLAAASDTVDAAFATELDRGFRQAQQHSATVLEAVLAGVVISRP